MNRIQKLEAEIQKLKKQEADKKKASRWKVYSHGAYFLRKNHSDS